MTNGAAGSISRHARAARLAAARRGRPRVARRADAERERLPPLIEAPVLDAHRQDALLDLAQPGLSEQLREMALAGARKLPTRRRRPDRACAPPPRTRPAVPCRPRDPRRTPPRRRPSRVTRAISRSPATGSAMKWTTSCARAASNAWSSNGSCSAAARCTSTPGWRSRAAATKGSEGSTADTLGSEPLDQFGRQRARAAADVEHPLAGGDRREIGEQRRERHRVPAHESVVRVGRDGEAHRRKSTRSPTVP